MDGTESIVYTFKSVSDESASVVDVAINVPKMPCTKCKFHGWNKNISDDIANTLDGADTIMNSAGGIVDALFKNIIYRFCK